MYTKIEIIIIYVVLNKDINKELHNIYYKEIIRRNELI